MIFKFLIRIYLFFSLVVLQATATTEQSVSDFYLYESIKLKDIYYVRNDKVRCLLESYLKDKEIVKLSVEQAKQFSVGYTNKFKGKPYLIKVLYQNYKKNFDALLNSKNELLIQQSSLGGEKHQLEYALVINLDRLPSKVIIHTANAM